MMISYSGKILGEEKYYCQDHGLFMDKPCECMKNKFTIGDFIEIDDAKEIHNAMNSLVDKVMNKVSEMNENPFDFKMEFVLKSYTDKKCTVGFKARKV